MNIIESFCKKRDNMAKDDHRTILLSNLIKTNYILTQLPLKDARKKISWKFDDKSTLSVLNKSSMLRRISLMIQNLISLTYFMNNK